MKFFSHPVSQQRRGFTLIEMLVVIAIIALVAALTVPSVQGGLRSARHTQSMSQLRQWGAALQMYALENRGNLPTRGPDQQPTWAQVTQLSNPQVAHAWYNVLPPFVDETPLAEIPANQRLQFLLGQTMHRDPEARLDRSLLNQRPLFTYSFNSQLNTSRATGNQIQGMGDLRNQVVSLSHFAQPGKTVIFFETRVNRDDGTRTETAASQMARAYGHSRHISFRYGGRANLAFLDGSVRRFRSDDIFNGRDVVNDLVYWSGFD